MYKYEILDYETSSFYLNYSRTSNAKTKIYQYFLPCQTFKPFKLNIKIIT